MYEYPGFVILFLCNGLVFTVGLSKLTPVVKIAQGNLRGLEAPGLDFREYLSIPYATVQERFQEPGPAPAWDDEFSATEASVSCPQYQERLNLPIGDENCLVLNVYTPGQSSYKGNLFPVMVFFPGEAYNWGSGVNFLFNPKPLVKQNVIVVTVNYRVGAFGFLCLRIKEAPGNAGLKDQVASLQWVKENINAFGGDPLSVTIFGGSTGSSLVSLLTLSSETRGLFRRAILHSGTALSPMAFSYEPIEIASLVASKMGYDTKNPYDLYNIFKNATCLDILMASVPENPKNPFTKYPFRPCAEKQWYGIKPFMTKPPEVIIDSGNYLKIIMMIGFTDREGIYYAGQFDEKMYEEMNDNFTNYLPDNLKFESENEKRRITKKIKDFYFGKSIITKDAVGKLIDYITDVLFHYPSIAMTEFQLQNTQLPLYNYVFKYDSYRNLGKILSGLKTQKGAAHTDDLFYIFQPKIVYPVPKIGRDMLVVDKMTAMWSNFSKYGDPSTSRLNSIWKPSENGTMRLLVIDESLKMESLANPKRINFWKNIYDD